MYMNIFGKKIHLPIKNTLFRRDVPFFILIFLLSLLAYRVVILNSGTVSRIDLDTVTPYNFPNWADRWISQGVYSWWEVNGGYPFFNPSFLPVIIFAKIASFILNADQFKQLLFVLFTALSGWSCYLMVKNLAFNRVKSVNVRYRVASLVAALAYMFNPWVFDHELFAVPYLFAYAIAPLALMYVVRAIDSSPKLNKHNAILAALTFSLVALLALPVGYMLFLATIVYFAFQLVLNIRKFKTVILGMIAFSGIFVITVLALNAYWVIPQFGSTTGFAPLVRISESDLRTNSVNSFVHNVFRLSGSPYGFFQEVAKSFANPATIILSFIIPLLSFSSLIIKPRDEKVVFFSALAAFSIALGSGILGPLGNGYNWLFVNVPYFAAFRVSYKFVFLTSLAYAYLLGVVTEYLTENAKVSRVIPLGQLVKYVVLLMLLLSLSLNVSPMLNGNMSGYLANFELPNDYSKVYNMIATQPGDFRVLLLPMNTPIKSVWLPANIPYIHNPLEINPPNHAVICQDLATPATSTLLKFSHNSILDNDTNNFNYLLTVLGVKYIVVNNDNLIGEYIPSSDSANWQYVAYGWQGYYLPPEQIMNFLSNNSELTMTYSGVYLSVFEYNAKISPRVYASLTSSLLVGGGYDALTEVPLSTIGLFASQYEEDYLLKNNNMLFSDVLFNNANVTDLALLTLTQKYLLLPYDYAYQGYSFNDSWCKSDYFPVTYEPYKQGAPIDGKFAFASANNTNMNMPLSIKSHDDYEVWVSVWFDSNGGTLRFTLDNNSVTVDTFSSNSSFKWVRVFGSTNLPIGEYSLEITNIEGQNIIDRVAIVPSLILNELQDKYATILQEKNVTSINTNSVATTRLNAVDSWNSTGNNARNVQTVSSSFDDYSAGGAELAYEKSNSVRYVVQVNASTSFFLVFSESFHEGWVASIDGQQTPREYHFIANGFANGWYINKTGTFTITLEFWPQNLFYAGSAISITTLIICMIYISKNKIKNISRKYIKKDKTLKIQPI